MATLHGFYGGAGHSLQPIYFENCVKRFKKWLSRMELMPRTIFEIGTGSGVVSCCWADTFNLPVTSIDIADQRYISKGEHNTERPNLVRLVGDCFQGCGEEGQYDPSVYPLNTFMDLLRRHTEEPIGRNGRLMLLCDGGDKVKEAKAYAPWLRDGDLLLLHDWFRDEETFERHRATGAWTVCGQVHAQVMEEVRDGMSRRPFLTLLETSPMESAFWGTYLITRACPD